MWLPEGKGLSPHLSGLPARPLLLASGVRPWPLLPALATSRGLLPLLLPLPGDARLLLFLPAALLCLVPRLACASWCAAAPPFLLPCSCSQTVLINHVMGVLCQELTAPLTVGVSLLPVLNRSQYAEKVCILKRYAIKGQCVMQICCQTARHLIYLLPAPFCA